MLLLLLARGNVTSLFVLSVYIHLGIHCIPINDGFSIKFNPSAFKEEAVPKTIGALFAKIPQDLSPKGVRDVLAEEIFPRSVALASGCTNQIARILFPLQGAYSELNDTAVDNRINYIKVPVMKQNTNDYRILVVSAPNNVKLGKGDAKPILVYIVFPTDNSSNSLNIPSIYFVNKSDGKLNLKSREKVDPILIIDNNRTVTGLKSKEVSKFVKFKNKLTDRFYAETNHLHV